MSALFSAFGIVFVAELGDKSMLLVMALATRYRWWLVLIGATLAAAVMMGLAVLFGEAAALLLPDWLIGFAAAALFFAFGSWTFLRAGDEQESAPAGPAVANDHPLRALATTFGLIAVGEFGDKTQIAVVSLSAINPGELLLVWVGATAAMAVVLGSALFVGSRLASVLPARRLRQFAGVTFLAFGAFALAAAVRSLM